MRDHTWFQFYSCFCCPALSSLRIVAAPFHPELNALQL